LKQHSFFNNNKWIDSPPTVVVVPVISISISMTATPPTDQPQGADDGDRHKKEQDPIPRSQLSEATDEENVPVSRHDDDNDEKEPPTSSERTRDEVMETEMSLCPADSANITSTPVVALGRNDDDNTETHDDASPPQEATPPDNDAVTNMEEAFNPPTEDGLQSSDLRHAEEDARTTSAPFSIPTKKEGKDLSTQPPVVAVVDREVTDENSEPSPVELEASTDADNKAATATATATLTATVTEKEMPENQGVTRIVDEVASRSDAPTILTNNDERRERPKPEHWLPPRRLETTLPMDSTAIMDTDPKEAGTADAVLDMALDFILPSSAPPEPPEPPARIFSSCDDDDEGGAVFAPFKTLRSKKKVKKRKQLLVKISMTFFSDGKIDETKKDEAGDCIPTPLSAFRSDIFNASVEEQLAQAEAELEDSLSFFRDSHEDQDPAFAAFLKSQKRKQIEAKLKALELEDEDGRKEIDSVINSQMKSKQASTDDQFERFKARKAAEEKQAMAKLLTLYNEKVASNQAKINQGLEELKKRRTAESQRFQAQHRQQVAQRNLPEHIASQEWANLEQQLSNKHRRQVQEFMGKGEDVKKRTESDYRREMAKIRNNFEKQVQDVETNRRSIYQKISAGYQQIRQRYIKRHLQKIGKKRELLESALSENDCVVGVVADQGKEGSKDNSKHSKEKQSALRPPSPIKSSGDGLDTFPFEKSGAASRHKHRKGVLSQISKQLSVEIHNEGVWMAVLQEKKDPKKNEQSSDPHTESDQKLFLPWGIKARDFLESIICGEIPSALESGDFDFGESVAMNGGHLRCILTDLRTSDETARMQRVQSASEQPNVATASLEQKALELQAAYNNADKIHANLEKDEKDTMIQIKDAMQDYEAKKLHWENFRSKFAEYWGAGEYDPTVVGQQRHRKTNMSWKMGTLSHK
jgi:hypothetical protein